MLLNSKARRAACSRALAVDSIVMTVSITLFETAIGTCGIAWGDVGLVGLQLPEGSPAATRRRLQRRFPQAVVAPGPPPDAQLAIERVTALLRGDPADLTLVEVDWRHLPEFDRRVYEITRAIPPGRTLTYGEIAARLSTPGAARDVGQALGRNPFPLVIPCHRVVAAGGKLGGFSATGGARTKLRLLEIEGAIESTPDLFENLPDGGPAERRTQAPEAANSGRSAR